MIIMSDNGKVRVKPGPMISPLPAVMVTVGTVEESNIITVAWTGIVNSDPPMTYISVKKSRFSHHILMQHREFAINLVTADLARAMDFSGVRTGEKVDKFSELGLTKLEGDEISAPLIAESPVNLECRVKDIIELPSHDMFLAEIVAVHIDGDMIDESGKYRFEDEDFVAFSHGSYFRVETEPIGSFGYSVMKKKTIKKRRKAAAGKKR